ncbi:hypothetical protein GCM10010309_22760 [Streptomyces violaceochromogenes]|nr:hypothetical protein GCM10010309_22760 [Streptomyces violaceochromogenes]
MGVVKGSHTNGVSTAGPHHRHRTRRELTARQDKSATGRANAEHDEGHERAVERE